MHSARLAVVLSVASGVSQNSLTRSKLRLYLIQVENAVSLLRTCGIQPTPQRIAVVQFILSSREHPSADEVLARVRLQCPTISRATVYNTLNLLVEKGLLKEQVLREGTIVFDANTERHHHFIDDDSGDIFDIPWESLKVTGEAALKGFEVRDFQVILRGKRKKR
jgi:Fe2+ or Zn2+ uptake regulation protein